MIKVLHSDSLRNMLSDRMDDLIWIFFQFVVCSAITVLSELWCSGSGGWQMRLVELASMRKVFCTDGLLNKLSVQHSIFLQDWLFVHCKNGLFCKNNNPSYIWIIPTPVDCKNRLIAQIGLFYRLSVQHSLFLQNRLFVQCKNNGHKYLKRMYGTYPIYAIDRVSVQ